MKGRRLVAGIAFAAVLALVGVAVAPASRKLFLKPNSTGDTPSLQALRARAANGDAGAQNDLGASYEVGSGVPQDSSQAAIWYRKAADQGLVISENNIGRLYATGQGVQRDYGEAMKWFQKAAAQRDGEAMSNIGRLYGEGDGVPQDKVESLKWLYRAAVRYSAESYQEPKYMAYNRVGLAATMTPTEVAEAQRLANLYSFEDSRPSWITTSELALLSKIGMDPIRDLEEKANYHWRWRAKRDLTVSTFVCPVGSTIDVSRTIVLLIAPQASSCRGERGVRAGTLKISSDGSAEPLPS